MSFGKHILINAGVGVVLFPLLRVNAVWFFVSSTLIDIDHYITFVIKSNFRYFDPRIMVKYYNTLLSWKHRKSVLGICTFHTLEFLFLVGVFLYIFKSHTLLAIFLGIIFHIICDFIFLYKHGIHFRRAHSFIEYFLRRSRMVKNGIDINRVYEEAINFAKSNIN